MSLNRREFVGLAGAAAVSALAACPRRRDRHFVLRLSLIRSRLIALPNGFAMPSWDSGPAGDRKRFRKWAIGMRATCTFRDIPQYEDHLVRYGHPSKFGYKEIVPLWRGENWNPDRLMGLYKKAGPNTFAPSRSTTTTSIAGTPDFMDGTPSKWAPGAMSSVSGGMRHANMACASELPNTLAQVGTGLE